MKVIILSNLYPPVSKGGAEIAAKRQAKKFADRGDNVSVITLDRLNKYSVRPVNNIKTYFLPHKNIFNYFDIGKKPVWLRFLWHIIDTFNFILASDVVKIVEKENPDLVISHNLKGLSLLTPKALKKINKKHYAVMHDVALYTPSGLIYYKQEDAWEHTGIFTRIYRFFTRKLFSYPEKIFFPSVWLLNFYRKNNFFTEQEKIFRANEVILAPPAKPLINSASSLIDKVVDKSKDRSGFLYVGKLERQKGVMLMLDAFKKINNETLSIVGWGGLDNDIKKIAREDLSIKFYGEVPNDRLESFYRACKAVIVPSLIYENAPNVVYEALSYGAKVIVSHIGGAYEPIVEGENGYTFETGNLEDLIEKMTKI